MKCETCENELITENLTDVQCYRCKQQLKFQHLRQHNSIVAHVMRTGGTVEDCVIALATLNDRLVNRILELEKITPRRIKMLDGSIKIWHCPDHLIPEINLPDN